MTTQTEQHLKAWVPVGYRLLKETAHTYNGVVTSADLAARVQSVSGRSGGARASWMGQLLEIVAMQAARSDDAPLASLCVHADGTAGERYRKAIMASGDIEVGDIERRAAEDRLECYRRYADDLPADGGTPRLTTRTPRAASSGTTRAPVRPKAPERPAPKVCPTCFMQIPATGVCDTCG